MGERYTRDQRELVFNLLGKEGAPKIAKIFNEEFPERKVRMTFSAIYSMKKDLKQFPGTQEEYLNWHDGPVKCPPYSDNENDWLIENTWLRDDRKSLAQAFLNEFGYIRQGSTLAKQIQRLNGKGNNLGKYKGFGNERDDLPVEILHKSLRLKPGQDLSRGRETKYWVICEEYDHETEKWVSDFRYGCNTCKTLNHSFRKNLEAPGVFYVLDLLDSTLNDFKLGVTEHGIEERAKRYGKYKVLHEIHMPIGDAEKFEGEMKVKYETYRTNNPMLLENGSTECFDKTILTELENDIERLQCTNYGDT